LAPEQLRALDRLRRVKALAGYYLAGGTAVAFHLRHRRSLDLDLFSPGADAELVLIQRALVRLREDVAVVGMTDATLHVKLGGEPVDVVRYPYPPLEAPRPGPAGFPVAGLLDLGVMKFAAIARRGLRRDFWDVFEIARAGLSLEHIGAGYVARYGLAESDLYFVARALTYFDDAEKDKAMPSGLTPARWRTIKRYFQTEAPRLIRT
jgi:hypothetical protein